MGNFFAAFNTVEGIKAEYRRLAMAHHPDRGGDAEIMKDINRQYQEALKACDGQKSEGDRSYTYREDVEQELMEKLLELLKLRGLEIALIGFWIWVSGDTKPNKEALKNMGLYWHGERQCWYYKPRDWKRTYQSKGSLGALAQKYGYKGFATAAEEKMPTKA